MGSEPGLESIDGFVSQGILLLDKPVGLTSNAVLGRAKRLLGIRKAGHTGTLDPLASGLMVLCFGEATKVSGFLLDADKAYEAECHLGITTDSEDAEGEVLSERPVPELGEDDIEQVLTLFRGPLAQIPPMFSALKHQGKRLYELARRGEVVERPPRHVTIHELRLLSWHSPKLQLSVRCSKGTYIRSLARDIGEHLGCGAHLSGLRRTASGPFRIDDAVGLDVLEGLSPQEAGALLLPADQALRHLPAVRLDPDAGARIMQGQRVSAPELETEGLVRLYAGDRFLGIGAVSEPGVLKGQRLFNA